MDIKNSGLDYILYKQLNVKLVWPPAKDGPREAP